MARRTAMERIQIMVENGLEAGYNGRDYKREINIIFLGGL
jgi:hypothetical protein